ncbi:unnamed protein product [Mytilus edulis]|uniref:Tetratricopeptide repeat protein n=1 Tax=Mytilus edulis TaxID=6550 RepID=A0A8S3VKP7_MYTED|nr:unnamed protein product [Mytilus edulis]
MCQKIVGTEGHVKTVRMMNSIRDNLSSQDDLTKITSGSFGEGLEIKGSDIDIMYVSKCAEVCESSYTRFNPAKTYFTMATEDTHPGFTHLRVVQCYDPSVFKLCEMNEGYLYFSSMRLKERILHMRTPLIHGPCMSDTNGEYDIAYCLHREKYFIACSYQEAISYNIIGIAYQLVGDLPSARQAFKRSIRLYADQDENSAFWRLSSISGLYQS